MKKKVKEKPDIIRELKKGISALQRENDKLRTKIFRLEIKILAQDKKQLALDRGNFNLRKKISNLQIENNKLKSMGYEERLQMLREHSKEEFHETPAE